MASNIFLIQREIKGIEAACSAFGLKEGLIITNEEEKIIQKNNLTIHIVPLYRWLLDVN